jgi:hypothetical protein
MNPALAALAVGVVAGGVIAVSARDARISIVGLCVALVFAPLVAEPFPGGLVLTARIVASLLSVYLLWIVGRDGFDVRQARLRWPVEALIATAAGLAGLSSAALTTAPVTEVAAAGLPEARAAAFAIGALAVIPILEGRDSLRLGTGLILAVLATSLIQQGMGSPVAPVAHLAFAAVMVGVAATSAALGSLASVIADRAERPVRAGAHPRGHVTDDADGSGPAVARNPLGLDLPLRRLADARVAERFSAVRTRSRTAVERVRAGGFSERTVGAVRRRLERPDGDAGVASLRPDEPGAVIEPEMEAIEPTVEAIEPTVEAIEPDVEATEPEAQATEPEAETAVAPTEPETPSTTTWPTTITARSAGARRSIPRRE